MSAGNIHSKIRNKPSANPWVPIALLPIPPKRLDKLPDYPQEEQELDALQVVHDIGSLVLSPLTETSKGIEIKCCDEKVRKCFPKLVAWLADHMKNCALHGILHKLCPICIAPNDEFGELPPTPFPHRAHDTYAAAYKRADAASLKNAGVKNINNALWHVTGFQPQKLVKPDMLHMLYLGILNHLMK